MRCSRIDLWIILAALLTGPLAANAATRYETVFAQLAGTAPDPAQVATVHDLRLKRDVAAFDFIEGRMALLRPIEGRVWGLVFTGRGTFAFAPPTDIEKEQLTRFYKTDTLAVPFDSVVLLFADSTLGDVTSRATFASGAIDRKTAPALRKCFDLLLDKKAKDANYSLMRSCLEGSSNDLFLAYIGGAGTTNDLVFEIDPFLTEQVQLWRPVRTAAIQSRVKNREVISQFPMAAERDLGLVPVRDFRATYEEEHYGIRSRFDRGLRLTADADLRFRSLEPGQSWLALALDADLDVDSVRWESGARAEFFKGPKGQLLWVKSDHPFTQDEERTLHFLYHGNVLRREEDWVFFDPAVDWYPRLLPGLRATYDLEYEYPASYTLASVGEPAPAEKRGDRIRSAWKVTTPIAFGSFMIGIYKEHKIQVEGAPPITVLMSEAAHRRVIQTAGEDMIELGTAPGKSMEKQVAADVANSLSYFQSLYGPTRLERFYAAENPFEHSYLGVAFPGLIHLDWSTFYNTQADGSDELLRAHEVAHQWWGAAGVVPATYHDQWLSEAFAQFSAWRYLRAASKDGKRFYGELGRSRDRILTNRKYLLGGGQEAGPIWLGPRTKSSTTQGDTRLIVYDKGAWVLHMLQHLFLDLNTMRDEGFDATMREFGETYAGKEATTADFQRVVEKHAGRDMSWFFHEWIYGTRVPRYRFAWHATPMGDGKAKVTCRVDQENVPEDFQMFVPLHLDFGGDKFAKVRVFLKGRHSEFDLPPMPMEPKRIVFNDLEAVLCEVENVAW
jgi:hypothetical protein